MYRSEMIITRSRKYIPDTSLNGKNIFLHAADERQAETEAKLQPKFISLCPDIR